jgi:autotransporter-associated beta strand protein
MKTNFNARLFPFLMTFVLTMMSLQSRGQTNNYFGTSGTITGNVWSTNPAGPYTSALVTTGGPILNFNNAGSATSGNITSTVGINFGASITWAAGGTIGAAGINLPINVSNGVHQDFGGSQSFSASGTAAFTKNGAGSLAMAGAAFAGGFTLNAGTLVARGVNAMGDGGLLTLNGGTIAANATRNFTDKHDLGITIGGDIQFGEVTGNVPLASSASNLTFSNNMSLGSSHRTLTSGGSGTYTFGGIISNSGANGITFAANGNGGSGTFLLTGANTYTGLTTVNGGTLRLNRSGGTTIPATNDVTVTSGTLRVSSNQTLNDLTVASGATLTVDVGVTLTINGIFDVNANISGNAGTIIVNGTLQINPGGAMAGTTTVNGQLTLSGGNITSTVSNLLTLGVSSTLTRTSGMVVGPVQKSIPSATGSHTFPIGDGTNYHPAIVNFTGSPVAGELRGEYQAGDPVFGVASFTHGGIAITDVCQTGYWQINAISGVTGGTYSVEVDATGFKMDNGSPLQNLSLLRLIKRPTAGSWAAEGTAAAPSNLNSISLTGLNTFSEFGVGGGGGAFPIELLYFTGHAETTSNIIEWATATEKNNQYQIVERSANGIDGWNEIGRKAGAGTSTTPISYKLEDADPLVLGYYRLRAVDFDGSEQISEVISILRESDELTIVNAFPVPVAEKLTLQVNSPVSGEVIITLTDAFGRIVLVQNSGVQRGFNEVTVEMEALASGIYQVTLSGGTVSVSKSIIK